MQNPNQLNNDGILFAQKGNYKKAISCFKKAIEIKNDNPLFWLNLGITYRDFNKIDLAIEATLQAHKLDLQNHEITNTLIQLFINNSELEKASDLCQKILAADDKNSKTWNLLGIIYFKSELYSKAQNCFETALSIDSFFADALFNLRDTYFELGDEEKAIECDKKFKQLEK